MIDKLSFFLYIKWILWKKGGQNFAICNFTIQNSFIPVKIKSNNENVNYVKSELNNVRNAIGENKKVLWIYIQLLLFKWAKVKLHHFIVSSFLF